MIVEKKLMRFIIEANQTNQICNANTRTHTENLKHKHKIKIYVLSLTKRKKRNKVESEGGRFEGPKKPVLEALMASILSNAESRELGNGLRNRSITNQIGELKTSQTSQFHWGSSP